MLNDFPYLASYENLLLYYHVTDGFPKKKKKNWIGGWVGGLSSIQFFLDFLNFFNFAKPLRQKGNIEHEK